MAVLPVVYKGPLPPSPPPSRQPRCLRFMDPTSTSLPKHHHQQPFTFASPISSETYDEDAVDFDYGSWIEQSKISNAYSSQDHSLLGIHREMMLQAVDNLPEEAYELSLRDITDLSLPRAAATTQDDEEAAAATMSRSSTRTSSNHRPWPKKTPSMERAGFIIKLFMPSPSRDAAASSHGSGRRKSFSRPTVSALRKNSASAKHCSRENAASQMENEPNNTRSNRTSNKSYQDADNRKSTGCYPFFNSRKYRVKQVAGGHFCL